MQLTEMREVVQERAGLESEQAAEETLVAVAEALGQREMDGAQDNFAAQLPSELAEVVQAGQDNGREKYDGTAFLQRVGERLGTSEAETKTRVHAAFSTMNERVSEGEQVDLVNALPNDLSQYAVWHAA